MSIELEAPGRINIGEPIPFRFSSDSRIAGRIRLTAGTEALSFRLKKEDGEPSEPAAGHRVRGKAGSYTLLDWGEHASGVELVLRFEGQKIWMTVE